MFDLLFITSIIGSVVQVVKEACAPTIPVENWANKELYHKDIMDGISVNQRLKNLENGKYKLSESSAKPHRDPVSGKIVIENCGLYNRDLMNYGAVQTMRWVEQGKYNLTQEELKKENERIKKHYEYLYSL